MPCIVAWPCMEGLPSTSLIETRLLDPGLAFTAFVGVLCGVWALWALARVVTLLFVLQVHPFALEMSRVPRAPSFPHRIAVSHSLMLVARIAASVASPPFPSDFFRGLRHPLLAICLTCAPLFCDLLCLWRCFFAGVAADVVRPAGASPFAPFMGACMHCAGQLFPLCLLPPPTPVCLCGTRDASLFQRIAAFCHVCLWLSVQVVSACHLLQLPVQPP
jgi:hypothetical protein